MTITTAPHQDRKYRRNLPGMAVTTAAAICLIVMPCAAAAQDDEKPELQMEDADDLLPGQSIWQDIASRGHVRVMVDLDSQRAYVYREETLIGLTTISSGRKGYETPTGTFSILQKNVTHRSNKYSSAPMPYMQRLTWDGVALHSGSVPNRRTSHGCIHLPRSFAMKLYAVTKLGDTVDVQGSSMPEDDEYAATMATSKDS